ncbi:hypothetical protein KJ969_01835 [Patescibacteria group bacterium]|nr:hypothetical protein [Patescibacteria group bacterium]MBU1922356.1 hypothetical protein [Patescibacteria group bacterium]
MAIGLKNNHNRLSKPERGIFRKLEQRIDSQLSKEEDLNQGDEHEFVIILPAHEFPDINDKILACLRRKYIKAGWYDVSFRNGNDGGTRIVVVCLNARSAIPYAAIFPILTRPNENLEGESKA